jgi:hypothetical protein
LRGEWLEEEEELVVSALQVQVYLLSVWKVW